MSFRGRVSGEPEGGGEGGGGGEIECADPNLHRDLRRSAAPRQPDGCRRASAARAARRARLDEDRLGAAFRDVHRKSAPLLSIDRVARRDQGVRPLTDCAVGAGGMLEEYGPDPVEIERRLAAGGGPERQGGAPDDDLRADAFAARGGQTDPRRLGDGRRARIRAHLLRLVGDPDL